MRALRSRRSDEHYFLSAVLRVGRTVRERPARVGVPPQNRDVVDVPALEQQLEPRPVVRALELVLARSSEPGCQYQQPARFHELAHALQGMDIRATVLRLLAVGAEPNVL